jgi:hypothetical protein
MRKGVVLPVVIGLITFTAAVIIGGSQADQLVQKNAYFQIKNLTDKAALAGASHWIKGYDEEQSEAVARSISTRNEVFGDDYSESLAFTWGDEELTASLPTFVTNTFWLRLAGKSEMNITGVRSTAEIARYGDPNHAEFCNAFALKPLAINNQELAIGDEKSFLFRIEPEWNFADKDTFYGLDLFAGDDDLHGADHVVLYRNELAKEEADYRLTCGESAGCNPTINFDIEDDRVVPLEDCSVTFDVLGAALTYGAGGYDLMVTAHAKIGGNWEDLGDFDDPTGGNLNDHAVHTYEMGEYPANTGIGVEASSYLYDGSGPMTTNSNWYLHRTRNGWDGSIHVQALRNGDPVPDFEPFGDQDSIEDFIEAYLDLETHTVTLENNQAIYLFELGMDNQGDTAYDMQDLVVLVTMDRSEGGGCENPISLLGAYLGTYTSNMSVDIGNTIKGLEDYTGYFNGAKPEGYDEDPKVIAVAILDESKEIVGFVNLKITSLEYDDTGNPEDRYVRMNTEVVGAPYARLIKK